MRKIYINRKDMKLVTSLLFLCLIGLASAQPSRILLLDGFLHVGNGETTKGTAFFDIKAFYRPE